MNRHLHRALVQAELCGGAGVRPALHVSGQPPFQDVELARLAGLLVL